MYNEETEAAADYGDNRPLHEITWWQVHIFAPRTADFRKHKKAAKESLEAAGFSITDIRKFFKLYNEFLELNGISAKKKKACTIDDLP